MIDPLLDNKVALITGANHGIGAATAKAFAGQHVKVFITFYREPVNLSEEELELERKKGIGGVRLYQANQQQDVKPLLDYIQSQGGIASSLETDLSIVPNIQALFDQCERELGPIDILVCNHTFCVLDTFDPASETVENFPIHLVTPQNIDASFNVNSRAYALLMIEYVKRYIQRKAYWGRIINLSTDAAHAHPANISYAASKHAIESYSRSAAVELGKYGITVNVVAPGPIQTGYLRPDQVADIAHQTPLQRVGRPEDVADVILFLASEQAHWLTGQLQYVGGGWRMGQ